MSYTKILLIQAAAQEAYDNKDLTREQYSKILDDLSKNIIKVDYNKATTDFKELINLYAT